MLATSVLDDAAAWLGLPIAFVVTSIGVGLLVERAAGLRLPSGMLMPLGATASICALLGVYKLELSAVVAAPLLVVAAVVGFALARSELRSRLVPGWGALAGSAVFVLYLAPAALTGHWTWNGYNFLNDTAVQFLLADLLQHHGIQPAGGGLSTRVVTISSYLGSGYPLGAHAHLATLTPLLGSRVDVVYQGYLAMLGVTAGLALQQLAHLSGLSPRLAAVAGAGAMSASLIYHYALQGSIKEVGAFACLATAASFGALLLTSEHPVRSTVPLGIAAGAMISVFSTAAGPYLVILALALVGAIWLRPRAPVRHALLPVAGVGALTVVVTALPTLDSARTFLQVSQSALGADSVATSTLGQLERPLELIQAAGVWLSEDYGLPVWGTGWAQLTVVLSVIVLVLAVAAVALFLRRREPGPLPLLLSALLTAAVVLPRASPYADAKLLALAAPTVVFTALCGALAYRGRARVIATSGAVIVLVAVSASAAFAYHGTRIASTGRLLALEDVADRVADRGWILLDEVEEFGKYYGRNAGHFNVAFDALSPRPASPSGGGYHVDLDLLEQPYVQEFDVIVTRKGPATSRPPANFRRIYANDWYEAWEKRPGINVITHAPLQDALRRGGTPNCRDVRALGRGAAGRDRLAAASAPEVAQLPLVSAPDRPLGWPPIAKPPGVVEPRTPGVVEGAVQLKGGTYDAWLRGSTGREVRVDVDGREAGSVKGINTEGQWLQVGTVRLPAGRHVVRLERPGGGLAPGDGAKSMLGPVALVRREPSEVVEVAPDEAASLCGRRWDWIEVVR